MDARFPADYPKRHQSDMSLYHNELQACIGTGQLCPVQSNPGVNFERVETHGIGAVWISAASEHSAAVLGNYGDIHPTRLVTAWL